MQNVGKMVFIGALVVILGMPSIVLAGSEPFVGEIMMFGANFCPKGWANSDGQLLPINQNQSLFSLLGTTYGGDGRTTFGLPDLRGRVPLHMGQGPGLTNKNLGTKGGVEKHALKISEMPKHQHGLNASKGSGSQPVPTGNLLATQGRKSKMYATSKAGPLTPMNRAAVALEGKSRAHNNMQPFLAIRFCIALQGVYPSRH